jgi:hypothetical protein
MNLSENLSKRLCEPFPLEDVEWRVSRAGTGRDGIFCLVLAYITARAIQKRLDDVCGPENWRNEEPRVITLGDKPAFACGISIRILDDDWVTKWDVAEPTNVEPAKGGFSGAMKRAGAQWGIGRYLYHLDETFAETSEKQPDRRWQYAKTKDGTIYYWKPPGLPAWALPKDPEHEVAESVLAELKKAWRQKFAADCRNPKDLREGFQRWVQGIVGEFPVSDHTCWTSEALANCRERIESTTEPNGPDSDVPFDGAEE